MPDARALAPGELESGLQAEFERDITANDITAFASLSGDWNPLHVDETYARQTNYGGRIVHGAFQVSLASAMAGMYLPGRYVVVGSFQCRFPAPLHYPSRVRVLGEITAWVPGSGSGTMRVRVTELAAMTLTAEIHVGFSFHESNTARVAAPHLAEGACAGNDVGTADKRPVVLLTGATGGLGRHLASVLARTYRVIAMGRSVPTTSVPTTEDATNEGMEHLAGDLISADWEHRVEDQLHGRKLHGIVHAAWPAGPQGGLLEVSPDAVAAQIEFGSLTTIRIARFLRSNAADSARLVVIGTTAATLRPVLNMSAYSLGKATLEHTIRLLAPELARAGITANLVAPSFLSLGMNAAKTSRAILSETAKVPMGRLGSAEDVWSAVEFFLSPGAAFVTGQSLPLTGGQL